MASIQPYTHSFVVKVWLASPGADGHAEWRGRVTHVPSGDSRHFRELVDLNRFIAIYLGDLGVRPSRRWRLPRRTAR